ncbi:MAG: glycine cleavage system protein GcvH [Desulfurococcaceae archaeon]|uniref:Probable glycine cleavage system H protein n=1 Tax=Staphylothermus marinus TaxID=2280 RepID=A0A7C4NP36_STAMA
MNDIVVEIGKVKYIVKEDRRYTDTHEWAKLENSYIRVGITDYAQKELKDIIGIELPSIGRVLNKGEEVGAIDSVKASSPYYAPVSGTVTEINNALNEKPELLNTDPYGEGWIMIVKPNNLSEYHQLLSPQDYVELLKRTKH